MSAAAELISVLRGRGVELRAEGEQLHLRAPAGTLTDEVKTQLRDHKPEVLQLLRSIEQLDSAPILEIREALVAVRIRSRSLGRELWLAQDERTARELRAEMDEPGLPVLLFEEIPKLRGKSREMLNAIFDTAEIFPGTRLLQ